jgi:hypothetical protein
MDIPLAILAWLGLSAVAAVGWPRSHREVGEPPIPDAAERHQPAA